VLDPAAEPFEVIPLGDLEVPPRLPRELSRLELTYALTPRLLSHLLDRGFERLLFVKQESMVTGSLEGVFELLGNASVALTPHLLKPTPPDAEVPILLAGVFNGGLVGVSRRGTEFLSWWRERVEESCIHDVAAGLHYEQRWLDLVPGLFADHALVRDPAVNVGHWNLHEREPPWSLVRFSGFDERRPELVSRYRDLLLEDIPPEAAEVWREYAARLGRGTREWPYAFDQFADEPVDAGSPPVARRWDRLWRRRADLREGFPDHLGADREEFARWTTTHGVRGE
jgi:hypothetical protein